MAGAILFDEKPYIYYKDTWYNLGDSVEIKEGDGFWLFARIKCTYTLASLGVTVRLIVDTKEVGKEYTSISCNGAVTTVWVYCTATKEGTAKAELWMGDLSQLIETKYSWAVSFPALPASDLLCYDATCKEGESVTLKASLAEKEYPFDSIGGKTITFEFEGSSYGSTTDVDTGLAQLTIPASLVPIAGTYTFTAKFAGDGYYGPSSCTASLTVSKGEVIIGKQLFMVLNPDGICQAGAIVSVAGKLCTTDSLGYCYIDGLESGKFYYAAASHGDYAPSDFVGFSCCSDVAGVILRLKPKVGLTYEYRKLCGTYPVATSTKDKITNWWKCAFIYAFRVKRICIDDIGDISDFVDAVREDVKASEGFLPYCPMYGYKPVSSLVEIHFETASFGQWVIGTFYCLCSHLPVIEKKDTIICDFDILDPAGENVVTDLYAGVRYWVRAWLCKVEGGGCAEILKGCDSGCEIAGEDLELFLFGQPASEASGTTNENGYTAFAWTPSEDIGSVEGLDNSIRVEFAGSTGYNLSETTWNTVTVTVKLLPYTINITVKDENGNPIEGAYVDIDQWVDPISRNEKRCTDSDVAVYVGECKEEEWKGDGYNVVTASVGLDKGKVSIGLPKEYPAPIVPTPIHGWAIRAGKAGYLNETLHEDWTEEQVVKGTGTHSLVFALTKITEEDKFVVHTVGFEEGDLVVCQEMFSECWFIMPFGLTTSKAPDAYPNGKVEFTSADGLEEGKSYGFYSSIKIPFSFPTGMTWCGGFKGIRDITLGRYGSFGNACKLMGIEPTSDECLRFWSEMIDPVYCANCITGVFKGVDVYGNEYHPGKFELAMFPIVVGCSFVPFLPGAKITKFLGKFVRKGVKHGDDILAVRKYFEDDYLNIYRIQAYGDDIRLEKWAKAIDAGDVTEARRWMDDILASHPSVPDAKAVGNFNSWLDELTKQIDNIDPKQVDEIADLRARVIGAANACMDDVTDFTKVYDEKYTEFIDVARKGSKDTRVATFVRSTDVVCSPTPFCKLSVLNAMDMAKFGSTPLDMLEYTKFVYKHGAHETPHNGFVQALRILAVSDESDIIALKGYMKADDWVGFSSWTDNVLNRFDANYVGQIDFVDNERVRILAQWGYEKVDHIMGSSGFRDEVTLLFDDLVKNVSESKKVVGDAGAYPRAVALNAVTEPDGAAKTIVKLMDNAPDVEHNVLFGGMWVSMEKATSLGYLGKGRVSRWTDDLVHAAMDDPHVYAYLKYDRPRIIEAIGKAELSKMDEFIDALKRGDIDGARIKLDDATKATPVGSIDRTYGIVRETEKVLDDVVPPATPYTRAQMHEMLDEMCENVYATVAKTPGDMKRVATGAELDSLRQIFQRGARRIIYRTSGGLKKLRRKRPDLAASEGELYSYTMRNGKIVSETYRDTPKKARNFIWRHWKEIGMIGTAAVIMVPWWAVDNAVFLAFMAREGGWIDKLWGNQWWESYWKIVDAKEKLELDPCVKAHQELYVGALEVMNELLQVDPVDPIMAESLKYNYYVQWGFTPSQPSETFKEQCQLQYNSDKEYYFQITQTCISPVEPPGGFTPTELPEQFTAVKVVDVIDGDTIDILPPDELPNGDEFYWEHGELIRVRISGINSPENKTYDYHGENRPFMVRRRALGGAGTEHPECSLVGDGAEHPECEDQWWASVATMDAHESLYNDILSWMVSKVGGYPVTLKSDLARQYDKYRRHLAVVEKDSEDIGVTELGKGYAVVFFYDANSKVNTTVYSNAESVAILKNIGVWPLRVLECTCSFGEATYRLNDEAVLYYANAPAGSVFKLIDPDGGTLETWVVEGNGNKKKNLNLVGTWKLTLNGTDCSDDDTAVVSEPVVCPPPEASFTVSSNSIIVGESVVFTDTSKGGGTQKIKSWLWDFGDGNTSTVQNPTHQFTKECDPCTVTLTVTNDCVPAKSRSFKDYIIVSPYILPPPKGDLTIEVYESRDFATALKVEHIYLDGIKISSGASAASKTNLLVSDNPYTVRVQFKETNQTCYADILDECSDTCTFVNKINIVADTVTTVRICPARTCLFISDPMGATGYIKQVDEPNYEEIPSSHTLPLGVYSVRFMGLAGYGTLEAIISITKDGVVCENVITVGGHCYTMSTPEISRVPPGLFVTGFLAKALLIEAITKTVTFESVPDGAVISVLD